MSGMRLTFFRVGCWIAVATAVIHLVGHVSGPQAPANETERTLLDLATTYRYALPGADRTLMDFMTGFSLSLSVFLALIAAVGLIVAKRASGDGPLMAAVGRAYGAGSFVLLVIALAYWFVVPVVLIGLMTVAFGAAAVGRGPGTPGEG